MTAQPSALPEIPVLETGPGFAMATLDAHLGLAHDLLDRATRLIPNVVLRNLDRVSRAWLERWDNPHLDEIDAIARKLDRPGAYFFSINYEWGCTCRVAASPDQRSARLARVLDWRTPGLGRALIAADVSAKAGRFITLTWPGYTGVLSAVAPGRFSAALNQAPMAQPTGVFVADWMINRRKVWREGGEPPAHLLRRVFEEAGDFHDAKQALMLSPLSTPAIFLLAGLKGDETAVIERRETACHVYETGCVAANHWHVEDWTGRARGRDSAGRFSQMFRTTLNFDDHFKWLKPPILNDRTRLVMTADASLGAIMAQGWEGLTPATEILKIGPI